MATTLDVLPTFAVLAGGRPPRDRVIDGHDISDLMHGKPGATTPTDVFYYYVADTLTAVRSGPWKLIWPELAAKRSKRRKKGKKGARPATPAASVELYNLEQDVAERNDVAARNPEIVARLTALADAARKELGDGKQAGTGRRRPRRR